MIKSGPKNVQARKLLQTLCKFIIPLAQSLDMKAIKNLDDIPLGVEADAFIIELENFMSGARPGKEDRSLTFFKDPLDYLEGTGWFWEKGSRSSLAGTREISAEGDSDEEFVSDGPGWGLQTHLEDLRRGINLMMPIRVLGVEPFGSEIKISLFDRNAVYNHLSGQLQAHWNKTGYANVSWISDHITYAILSHTWTQMPGEFTYVDWQKGSFDSNDPKCQKLINFCKTAYHNHGLTFSWVDTVCINKESSSELDESIRSMYKWYSDAKVCITYLGGTNTLSDMARDPWFTRGWTFQELVAPRAVKFYNKDWEQLVPLEANDKLHLPILESIQSATQITPTELKNIRAASISRRMELAARRIVTREEDEAYSLMGIFNVSISTAYGEGEERAFFRLLKEIFDTHKDVLDIFNWGSYSFSSITSLFPRIIYGYTKRCKDPYLRSWHPLEPLTLTHLGLRTPVLLMSALKLHSDLGSDHQPVGDFCATISIGRQSSSSFNFNDTTYALLQNKNFKNAVGILNVEEHRDVNSICISKVCFALLLEQQVEHSNTPGRYNKIGTQKPIVFTLKKGDTDINEGQTYYVVRKDELDRHGMKLVILYL